MNMDELMTWVKRHGLANDLGVQKGLLTSVLHPESSGSISKLILMRNPEKVLSPEPFPYPVPADIAGTIRIGMEPRINQMVGLDVNEVGHTFVSGMTQRGKSNLEAKVIPQLIENGISIKCIDPKLDGRGLIKKSNIYPVKPFEIPFNPLAPPVKGFENHYRRINFEAFCQEEDLLKASHALGNWVLSELNEIAEKKKREPNPHDFLALLKKKAKLMPYNSPKGQSCQRVIEHWEGILSVFGETFDCVQPYPAEELANENIIIETDLISDRYIRYPILSIVTADYFYRKQTGRRGHGINEVFFIFECDRTLSKTEEMDYKKGVSLWNRIIAESKEFGMVFWLSNQNLKISSSILENCDTVISFRLRSPEDIMKMGMLMNIDRNRWEVFQELHEIGRCIISRALKGTEPYFVQVDYEEIDKSISDDEVKEHSSSFLDKVSSLVVRSERLIGDDYGNNVISEDEESLIKKINEFPTASQNELASMLGIANSKLIRLRDSLRRKGFIEVFDAQKKGRGGSFKLFGLASKANDFLKERGIKITKTGRGGVVHYYYCLQIMEKAKSEGYTVEMEVIMNGNFIDLLLMKGQLRKAVEIQTTSKGVLSNIKKLLPFDFDEILILATEKKDVPNFKKYLSKLSPSEREKVTIAHVLDYM